MSLSNMMRRAASLLVEMPPEPAPSNIKSSDVPELDDIDLELPPEARVAGLGGTNPGSTAAKGAVPTAKTIDQIVREAEGPNLEQVRVDENAIHAAKPGEGGGVDFAAVYRAAKLPDASFGAEQMLETLTSLPQELPLETRRATVKAMLATLGKTTGATPESIVADASRKLAALESFAAFMEKRTEETIGKAQTEIAELEAQIEARKTAIQNSKNELARIVATCEGESERLDDVLEFFSLDVGASKHAPQASSSQASTPRTSPGGGAATGPKNAASGTASASQHNPAHFQVVPPKKP